MAAKRKITQQESEKRYFKMFREDYQLPSGKIIYGDRPDVIIDGERLVGIEITNFYIEKGELPESEQRQRKLRDEAVLEAQRIYKKGKRKKIGITFEFDKANPIRNKRELVKNLADLAGRIENLETGRLNKDIFKSISELSLVYLNAPKYDNPQWRVTQVYTVTIMSRDRLVEIIRVKEGKSKEYKKCAAYWLLVIVDFFDPAQDQEIRIDGFDKIDTGVFEKVIVYKTIFRTVIEL